MTCDVGIESGQAIDVYLPGLPRVTGIQATFQNDLKGLFSSAELHRRSVAVVGPFKRSHYREAAKQGSSEARVYRFLLLQSRRAKLPGPA